MNTINCNFCSTLGDGFELPGGNHNYQFACTLPDVLPTSFEGGFGHVRYTVKIVLERPMKFDHKYRVGITVLQQLNLNNVSPPLRVSAFDQLQSI